MSNVFASDVHKQFFLAGVQDENRDALPMRYVSEIETENAEYIINRYGSDVSAQSTPDSTYRRASGFTYNRDKKSIDEEATVTDEILYKELMREGFDIVADRTDKHAFALAKAIHRHAARTTRLGAGNQLDAGNLAGSASDNSGISMSASNPDEVSATVVQLLQESNAYGSGNPYVMMTPKQAKFFNLFSMGAGFKFADQALERSIFQTRNGTRVIRGAMGFGGLDVIVTNELPRTLVVTLADELDATDTLVVNGVTFTVVASPSSAGDVDQGSDAEGTVDAFVAAINNADGAAASTASSDGEYVELTQADRTTLQNAGVKARKLSSTTFEIEAFTALSVSKTGDETTIGTAVEHMLAGAYNSTTICLPSQGARTDEKPLPAIGGTGVNGFELTTFQMHDAVVWTKDAPKIVDILVA